MFSMFRLKFTEIVFHFYGSTSCTNKMSFRWFDQRWTRYTREQWPTIWNSQIEYQAMKKTERNTIIRKFATNANHLWKNLPSILTATVKLDELTIDMDSMQNDKLVSFSQVKPYIECASEALISRTIAIILRCIAEPGKS